jgi:hypothetical protein
MKYHKFTKCSQIDKKLKKHKDNPVIVSILKRAKRNLKSPNAKSVEVKY